MTNLHATRSLLFTHAYEIELLDEFPTNERRFYYPGAESTGGKDGLVVHVEPSIGRDWIGVFAFGDQSHELLSGVFSTPSANVLCVVSGGSGYLVHSDKPEWWSEAPLFPITRVIELTEAGLMIFADFTSLCAWGTNGVVWRSQRLAWDDLTITSFENNMLLGYGFDPILAANVPFAVDALTGDHTGGSSPETHTRNR